MNGPEAWNDLSWYLVNTHPRQEARAETNLISLGVEILAPKCKERKRNFYTGEATYCTKPIFPNYIFARFIANNLHQKIRYTRGVRQLVSFGDTPAIIEDEIIDMVRSRIKEDGYIWFIEDLKPGDEVIIKDGPLKDFAGVFEREMQGSDRVRILLRTVSYQAHVEIEKDLVKKIKTPDLAPAAMRAYATP
jgi:transcriptional antiterminator RfaH